jgi:hypothetical protein
MSPKNAAAVALGRKGGQARAKKLTSEERSDSARKAVEARWAKQRAELKELNEGAKELLAKSRAAQARLAKQKRATS